MLHTNFYSYTCAHIVPIRGFIPSLYALVPSLYVPLYRPYACLCTVPMHALIPSLYVDPIPALILSLYMVLYRPYRFPHTVSIRAPYCPCTCSHTFLIYSFIPSLYVPNGMEAELPSPKIRRRSAAATCTNEERKSGQDARGLIL